MWESPTHWPPGSGRPLRRSSPPTHRSAGSSDEDLRSASAIVTAAEPIWATFPARASKSGCRAANRNPPPRRQKQGAGPAGGDGNGADRAPRCERSISAQCERPTPGPRRARCGRAASVMVRRPLTIAMRDARACGASPPWRRNRAKRHRSLQDPRAVGWAVCRHACPRQTLAPDTTHAHGTTGPGPLRFGCFTSPKATRRRGAWARATDRASAAEACC